MISAPLTTVLGRTKSRPVILGYQSQTDSGPFAAIFGFKSDTNYGDSGVGGFNLGYTFNTANTNGELGASVISSIDNSGGMQITGAGPNVFGGFASLTNGNENVKAIPAVDVHGILRFDRYNLTAEWVSSIGNFRTEDLSFNGHGAQPQALQLEAGQHLWRLANHHRLRWVINGPTKRWHSDYPSIASALRLISRYGKIPLKVWNIDMTWISKEINSKRCSFGSCKCQYLWYRPSIRHALGPNWCLFLMRHSSFGHSRPKRTWQTVVDPRSFKMLTLEKTCSFRKKLEHQRLRWMARISTNPYYS